MQADWKRTRAHSWWAHRQTTAFRHAYASPRSPSSLCQPCGEPAPPRLSCRPHSPLCSSKLGIAHPPGAALLPLPPFSPSPLPPRHCPPTWCSAVCSSSSTTSILPGWEERICVQEGPCGRGRVRAARPCQSQAARLPGGRPSAASLGQRGEQRRLNSRAEQGSGGFCRWRGRVSAAPSYCDKDQACLIFSLQRCSVHTEAR